MELGGGGGVWDLGFRDGRAETLVLSSEVNIYVQSFKSLWCCGGGREEGGGLAPMAPLGSATGE